MKFISPRIQKCGSWWRGATERERFLLYYTCLRWHYEMPAQEAFTTAQENWPLFGSQGDLISTIREAIHHDWPGLPPG